MRSSRLWSHKNKYNLKKEQEPFKTNQEYTKLDVTPMIFFSFVSCYLKFRLSQIQINIVYICVGSLLLDLSLLMDIKTGYIYIYIYLNSTDIFGLLCVSVSVKNADIKI